MNVLIFGGWTFPDVYFKNSPKTGLEINAKGSYLLNYEGLNTITWGDLLKRTTPDLTVCQKGNAKAFPEINRVFDITKNKGMVRNWIASKKNLFQLAANAAEKKFLNGYFELCELDLEAFGRGIPPESTHILNMPALIPQVWVNWIPIDFKAERKKNEPQRIDFLMFYEGRQIITEIDDFSHFAEMFDVVNNTMQRKASMEKFTMHLRKDRWLRKEGYEVWRFSDLEVDESKVRSQDECKDEDEDPWSHPTWVVDFFYEMGFRDGFFMEV